MNDTVTAQALPPLLQNAGVPFDVFIQALTEQLDKAQASMALKARVGKLPMTFAVKDIALDLNAFVQMIDDDVYVRPSGPGDTGASTIKLSLTTITKPMIEENAMNFHAEDPKFSLREALGNQINEEDRRSLERIGVRSIGQLNELRKAAGADVVARLARMPINRLQQAMLAAAAPRVTRIEQDTPPRRTTPADRDIKPFAPIKTTLPSRAEAKKISAVGQPPRPTRIHVAAPLLRNGRVPLVRAAGEAVPVIESLDQNLVLEPLAHQLGSLAELDFGDGEVASVHLSDGSVGVWQPANQDGTAS